MRLTNNIIMRKYLTNLNNSLRTLQDITNRATTQRRFERASEDPAAALKVFHVKRDLTRLSIYKSNVGEIQRNLADIEATISSLNDILIEVNAQVTQGQNTAYDEMERKAIASVIRNLQQQVLNNGNAYFAGKYIFGGTNVKEMPFTVDSNGKLLYNGQDVDTGVFSQDQVYIDIGMGISMGAEANANTAYNISYPGHVLLGSGVDENGITNNIYNLMGELASMFENNDLTELDKYANKLQERMRDLLVQYADVGERSKYVDFILEKLDIDRENAINKQDSLEHADIVESFMDYKYQEMAYNAALQIGSRLMQNSLLDYMR